MDDVGRLAGVTRQTVSRVVNANGYVKASTRQSIEAAIRELGFQPNRAARTLASSRSEIVGVLALQGPGNGIFESIVHGVGRAAYDAGYSVSIIDLDISVDDAAAGPAVERAFERFVSEGVDGVIVLSDHGLVSQGVAARSTQLPTVLLFGPEHDGLGLATIDSRRGGRLAAEHLLSLGHTRLIHLAGERGRYDAMQREQGFREALQESGIEPVAVVYGDWMAQSGFEIGQQLALRDDFTALFCANDQMALGAVHAFSDAGVRVPSDISVVGYDDIAESAHFLPPLTTVRQDFEAVGGAAFTSMLAALSTGRPKRAVISPEVTVRSSTGPPRIG